MMSTTTFHENPYFLPVSSDTRPPILFSENAWVPDTPITWDLKEQLLQNHPFSPGSYVIAVEGVDGSGKTSLIKNLVSLLREKAEVKRSPGGTPLGENIREVFKKSFDLAEDSSTEQSRWLLVEAARSALFGELERRSLDVLDRAITGVPQKILFLDRHVDSTRVYQPLLGVSAVLISSLHQLYKNQVTPDVTFFIDVDSNVAKERIGRDRIGTTASGKGDYDYKEDSFFQEVINRYRRLVCADRQQYYVIDGNQPSEKLAEELMPVIQKYLNNQSA